MRAAQLLLTAALVAAAAAAAAPASAAASAAAAATAAPGAAWEAQLRAAWKLWAVAEQASWYHALNSTVFPALDLWPGACDAPAERIRTQGGCRVHSHRPAPKHPGSAPLFLPAALPCKLRLLGLLADVLLEASQRTGSGQLAPSRGMAAKMHAVIGYLPNAVRTAVCFLQLNCPIEAEVNDLRHQPCHTLPLWYNASAPQTAAVHERHAVLLRLCRSQLHLRRAAALPRLQAAW